MQRVPILVYHHIYPDESPEFTSIGPEDGAGVLGEAEFRRQMRHLGEGDWTVVSTSRIINWLIDDAPVPEKAVALHFDNGWLDTITVALPILAEFGFKATCFPITDGLEAASNKSSIQVRTLTEGVVEHPFMTWQQIEELATEGWEIGAHTATHCKVADMHAEEGDDGVIREAETSNNLFEKHLGLVPEHFAYPSGSRNGSSDAVLSRYYRSLRLWDFSWPIDWSFTSKETSPLAVECQNIDVRVPFEDFERIFSEAQG